MFYTEFQPNISSGSGEKVDFSGLLFLATAAIFDSDQPEFYHSGPGCSKHR